MASIQCPAENHSCSPERPAHARTYTDCARGAHARAPIRCNQTCRRRNDTGRWCCEQLARSPHVEVGWLQVWQPRTPAIVYRNLFNSAVMPAASIVSPLESRCAVLRPLGVWRRTSLARCQHNMPGTLWATTHGKWQRVQWVNSSLAQAWKKLILALHQSGKSHLADGIIAIYPFSRRSTCSSDLHRCW